MSKRLTYVGLVIGTIVLMVTGAPVAFAWAITVLYGLGSKIHGVYDYYGYHATFLSNLFLVGTTGIGFIAPAVIVWRLHKNSWQVSLRMLFVTMTLVALLVASFAYFLSL